LVVFPVVLAEEVDVLVVSSLTAGTEVEVEAARGFVPLGKRRMLGGIGSDVPVPPGGMRVGRAVRSG